MTDDYAMRFRLQQVAAYRQLCRSIRRGGVHNVVFAAIMLWLAWYVFQGQVARGAVPVVFLLYVGLALAELGVGLLKWVYPSAEGVLLDGLILLLFAGWNLGWQGLALANGVRANSVILLLGGYMLVGAVGRFREYRALRKVFADRPSRDQITWFDDLVREIRTADPELDDQAIDLPTRPHWKAKLLGTTAFFVPAKGDGAVVAGPGAFELARDPKDHGTGKRKAWLQLYGRDFPPFEVTDASWANYQKWVKANAEVPPQT
jgi:hypothetical protein